MAEPSAPLLALEAGRIGLFEWDIAGGEVHLSDHALALHGLESFDGQYESWLDCIFREDRIRVANLIETALAEGAGELTLEFRISRPAEQTVMWIESRNVIVHDGRRQAQRMVGVHVDITEQKRALVQLRSFTESLEERVRERTRELEAEFAARRKAEESLRQTQKMEAVGQLTGGIAHDFNNLLTVVLGGLEVIGRHLPKLQQSPSLARIGKAREMAVQGAQRAAALVQRLMAFSRQQSLAPIVIDANLLVGNICELLRRTLGESIALETVLAGGLWPTYADANQLENAILNLAVNARDAMPQGGKLTIETANCQLDTAYVAMLNDPVAPGQYVLLAVTDTGCGMDAATVEKAFEPFFTTKEVGKGTGLGLSQVYGFVRQSCGHIRIYSEIGEGSSIKIYLPRHLGDAGGVAASSAVQGPGEAPQAIGAECVLVVEDDEVLRAHAVEILQELGYRVLQAYNGPEALEALERHSDIDLLFTDVVMPGGLDGRQLAEDALRRRPWLKVLFTTGYTRDAVIRHGRLDSGLHMITKPYAFDELAAKVRERLDAP